MPVRSMPRRPPVPLAITDELAKLPTIRARLEHLLTLDVWPRTAEELQDLVYGDRSSLKGPLGRLLDEGRLTVLPEGGLRVKVYVPAGFAASDEDLAPYLA